MSKNSDSNFNFIVIQNNISIDYFKYDKLYKNLVEDRKDSNFDTK